MLHEVEAGPELEAAAPATLAAAQRRRAVRQRALPPSAHSRHHRSIWGLGNSGGTMRITVNVEIGPEEVPMATELLAVLR